jgi:hypothetical protein
MELNDWLTLLAIVLGPMTAVSITLWIEHRRRVRERQLQIMRMLLSTRHTPANPQYNAAINLIPAEFNSQPEVMAAWRRYHDLVNQHPTPADLPDHQKRMSVAQSALIFQIMVSLGLKLSEGDIQTQAYISQAFVERDTLYLKSLQALPEMAATMKEQVALTQRIVDALPARPPSERQP